MEELEVGRSRGRSRGGSGVPLPRKGKKKSQKRSYPFPFRLPAVKLHLEEGYSAPEVSSALGISKHTLYEWTKRYREQGEAGLRVSRRKAGGKRLPSAVTERIVRLKREHPGFGIKRISQTLRRLFFLQASPETVRQTLKEEQLVDPPKRKPKRSPPKPRFFERARPNQLWQSDIFTFRLGGRNAYLIGFLDDHSRYVTGLGVFRSQTAEHVLEVYRRAVGEFGVPQEMLTDNGRQYTNWRGTTRFEAELKKDRIRHLRSRPHHPMTLGKIERFWKTIWTEFLSRAQFDSFESAQARIQLWVKYYNHRRVHQGIDGHCPADRFFGVQSELRDVIERGIQDNLLELALRGEPRRPFYMVGRLDRQSVVMRAEKGKLVMTVNDEQSPDAPHAQELVYDLEKGTVAHEAQEDDEAGAPGVHGSAEVGGGVGSVDGAAQAVGVVPGAIGELDDAGQLAATGARGDATSIGPEATGEGAVAGPHAAAGEIVCGPPLSQNDSRSGTIPAGPASSDGPGDPTPCRDVALGEGFWERSVYEAEPTEAEPEPPAGAIGPGGGGAGAGGGDPQGPQRPVDGDEGRGTPGGVPQDLLRMGAAGSGRPAGRGPGAPAGPSSSTPGRGEGASRGAGESLAERAAPGEPETDGERAALPASRRRAWEADEESEAIGF